MSPEQLLRLMKTNAILSGIVSGIMIAMGMAFFLLGFIGFALGEEGIALMALTFGIIFLGLSAHICPRL